MALTIPNGFGQVVLSFTFSGGLSNPLAMVFGYENNTTDSASVNAVALLAVVGTQFATNEFDDDVVLNSATTLENPGADTGFATGTTAGGGNGTSFPPSVCMLVHKQSALGGRQNRGRMYWPAIDRVAANEAGVLDATFFAAQQSNMNDLLLGLAAADLPMHILHTNPATSPTFVTALVVDPVLATQRRRLRS